MATLIEKHRKRRPSSGHRPWCFVAQSVTGYELHNSGSIPGTNLLFGARFRPHLWLSHWYWNSSIEKRRPRHEADHSLPSSVEVNNDSTPHTSSWRSALQKRTSIYLPLQRLCMARPNEKQVVCICTGFRCLHFAGRSTFYLSECFKYHRVLYLCESHLPAYFISLRVLFAGICDVPTCYTSPMLLYLGMFDTAIITSTLNKAPNYYDERERGGIAPCIPVVNIRCRWVVSFRPTHGKESQEVA